jgi:tRNA G18 (ribose-2'-O)-methylase SpoU
MCFDSEMIARPQRIEVLDLDDPRLVDYQNLKDATLASRRGRFIVEGRGTLEVLLERSAFRPDSILLSERTERSMAKRLDDLAPECPIFVANQSLLDSIVGFPIHRGCLAACQRPGATDPLAMASRLLAEERAPRLVMLEGIRNLDNVGGIFRNSMALGGHGVILCAESCDPLYRKAIRTSMGGTLCLPFARASNWPGILGELRELGYEILAMDPGEHSVGLNLLSADSDFGKERPIALLLGTEGEGLSQMALEGSDRLVRIEMETGVDSLNVSVALGIALHALRPGSECS